MASLPVAQIEKSEAELVDEPKKESEENSQKVAELEETPKADNSEALPHKEVECLEQSRKIGAKCASENIVNDEVEPKKVCLNSNYDSKHQTEKVEQTKSELAGANKLDEEGKEGNNRGNAINPQKDDEVVATELAGQVGKRLKKKPTKLDLLRQEFEKKKAEFKAKLRKEILERYGEEYLEKMSDSISRIYREID